MIVVGDDKQGKTIDSKVSRIKELQDLEFGQKTKMEQQGNERKSRMQSCGEQSGESASRRKL